MAATYGELVLILGDLHIPHRAAAIPEEFNRMLVPNKMQHILCTGNCNSNYLEYFKTLAPNVHAVCGDFDDTDPTNAKLPETKVLQVGQFRIGLIHGHQVMPWGDHQVLALTRRKLNVDILVHGHTHDTQVLSFDNNQALHINPGSITGAFTNNNIHSTSTPSFILLSVQGEHLIAYVYELIDGHEVTVSKTEFTKKSSSMNMNI